MDNIAPETTPIRDCADERFQKRKESFFNYLESFGKTIPKNDVEGMIAGIIAVLEEYHVTYNQAHEILNLVKEALALRAAQVRM